MHRRTRDITPSSRRLRASTCRARLLLSRYASQFHKSTADNLKSHVRYETPLQPLLIQSRCIISRAPLHPRRRRRRTAAVSLLVSPPCVVVGCAARPASAVLTALTAAAKRDPRRLGYFGSTQLQYLRIPSSTSSEHEGGGVKEDALGLSFSPRVVFPASKEGRRVTHIRSPVSLAYLFS